MTRARWLVLAVLAVSASAGAEPSALEKSARAIVDAQLAATGSPAAFLATLAPDAVILGNGSFTLANGPNAPAVVSTLAQAPGYQTILTGIDAGGSAQAMWFSADVAFVGEDSCDAIDARLFELAIADGARWKVIAMSFASTSGLTAPGDQLGTPRPGPLTALLRAPDHLATALREDAATALLIGDVGELGDLALGRDAARHLFAPLRFRDVAVTSAIELHGGAWGVAAAEITFAADPHSGTPSPSTARALLFAVPDGRRWQVVALHVVGRIRRRAAPDVLVPCPAARVRRASLEQRSITP